MSSNTSLTRISRRRFLMSATTVASGLLLAACVPMQPAAAPTAPAASQEKEQAPTNAPAAKDVTVTVLWAGGGIADAMRECIKEFKDVRPEVTFKITEMEQEQKRASELQLLTNPGAPNLHFINFGSGLTAKLVAAKAIAPLDPYYEKFGWWKFLPEGLKTHGVDGKVYFYSTSTGTAPLIWVNKELQDKVGQPFPNALTSLDGLAAWADACHAKGFEPLAMGDRDGWPGFHMYDVIARRLVSQDGWNKIVYFSQPGKDAKMADTPGFENAFQLMNDFQTKKVWSKGVLDLNDEEAKALFMDGKAVAYETGPWATDQLRKALGDKLDFELFPQLKQDVPMSIMAGWYEEFVASAQAPQEVQDAIADLFDYVLSKKGQRWIAKFSQLPIRTDMTTADMEGFADPLKGKLAELMGKTTNSFAINDFWSAEMYALLRTHGQTAISGQKTPAEIVKEFDDLAAKERSGQV